MNQTSSDSMNQPSLPVSLLRFLAKEDTRDERDRLARRICEWVRVMYPQLPPADYLQLRQRVHKTSLPVLRQILEEVVMTDLMRRLLPQGLGAR